MTVMNQKGIWTAILAVLMAGSLILLAAVIGTIRQSSAAAQSTEPSVEEQLLRSEEHRARERLVRAQERQTRALERMASTLDRMSQDRCR